MSILSNISFKKAAIYGAAAGAAIAFYSNTFDDGVRCDPDGDGGAYIIRPDGPTTHTPKVKEHGSLFGDYCVIATSESNNTAPEWIRKLTP